MPVDALVGLRVRLSHLPCLVALGAADPDAEVACLADAGLLDAGLTVLDTAGCGSAARERLARAGARHGTDASVWARLWAAPPAGYVTSLQAYPAAITAYAEALSPLHAASAPPEPAAAAALVRAATVGSTTALGLRGGALFAGDWADLYSVSLARLQASLAAYGHLPMAESLPCALVAAGPIAASDVMVAGSSIIGAIRDGAAVPS